MKKLAAEKPPKQKPAHKARLTDEERHARFVEMAREVEAEEKPEAFEQAFRKVVLRRAEGT